ncbi:DUF47 family protein [bacterium]|nr:DUF47 family protein [bacterium]
MNLKFLLPQQSKFFDLFEETAECLIEISTLFKELATSFKNQKEYSLKAKEIERKADLKTHNIIDMLNKSFITPFDREDIYELAHEIDDIVDHIENVMHNFVLFHIYEKKTFVDEFALLFNEAAINLEKLINCMTTKKASKDFYNYKVIIHELEDQGDLIYQNALHELFKEEKDPIAVVKWKDILENLERVMDQYQRVCNVIEGIIVKST